MINYWNNRDIWNSPISISKCKKKKEKATLDSPVLRCYGKIHTQTVSRGGSLTLRTLGTCPFQLYNEPFCPHHYLKNVLKIAHANKCSPTNEIKWMLVHHCAKIIIYSDLIWSPPYMAYNRICWRPFKNNVSTTLPFTASHDKYNKYIYDFQIGVMDFTSTLTLKHGCQSTAALVFDTLTRVT